MFAANGSEIRLKFVGDFDIEYDASCYYDYVEVSTGSITQEFCGNTLPAPITSTGGSMTIRFHTDSSVTGRGFRAVYTQITGCDGGDSCCSSDNQCADGEGDCDYDGDCLSGICGTDNCVGEGFDSTDDCCEPSPSNLPSNPACGYGYGSGSYGYGSVSHGYGSPSYGYGSYSYGYGSPSYGYGSQSYGYNSVSYGYGSPSYEYGSASYGYGSGSYGYGSASNGYGSTSFGYGSTSYEYSSASYGK